MAIGKGYGNKPVYGRFQDTLEAHYPNSPRLRRTAVFMKQDDRSILVISTVNNQYRSEFRATRLTVEQARELRGILDEFLADQLRPEEDFAYTPPVVIPDPRRKPTL